MPGYLIHLAACPKSESNNREYIWGIEAPDILKKWYKLWGIDGCREKYNSIKTSGMPDFSRLEGRIHEKEQVGTSSGLHFGVSSSPDLLAFWNWLDHKEIAMPFWHGYSFHLLTDAIVYSRLKIEEQFQRNLAIAKKNNPQIDSKAFMAAETSQLHADWDRINAIIRDRYGVSPTPEVEELGVVKYCSEGQLKYVEPEIIIATIDFLREM